MSGVALAAIDQVVGLQPQDRLPKGFSKNLSVPDCYRPEAPPLRPERHLPNSIATMRRRLIAALVNRLARCPCCAAPNRALSLRV
jgi:hypothetical protein